MSFILFFCPSCFLVVTIEFLRQNFCPLEWHRTTVITVDQHCEKQKDCMVSKCFNYPLDTLLTVLWGYWHKGECYVIQIVKTTLVHVYFCWIPWCHFLQKLLDRFTKLKRPIPVYCIPCVNLRLLNATPVSIPL